MARRAKARSGQVLATLLLLLGGGTPATAATPAAAAAATAATPTAAAAKAPARAGGAPPPVWTGTWEAAPSGTAPGLAGTTIRNVVHTSVGGRALRVRLSNRLGTAPLRLGAVTVALRRPGGPGALPGSLRTAAFRGARTITVPPGRDAVTDPVRLALPAAAELLVTVYTPGDPGPATYHRTALRTSYLAPGGDRTADEDGAAFTATTTHWYYVTGVDVLGAPAAGSAVALGDSLTDGTGSSRDADHRWPDRLAERLRALPPPRRLGVLNAGISGNRLLRDGVGPSALSRLDADALCRSGVRVLVVWEGINDVNGTPAATGPAAFAAAYSRIVARAHAHGIRVVGATLTPYGGHSAYTPAREAVRQAVNALIRGGALFDAVADFDAAVRDPSRPQRLRPAYDPGDHLHLNDTGMRAVADTIDPAALGAG
ncbi:SGNH/GDSL hydrolase family protein [Streptomyces sp. NPDC020801]|uniref:SGNH/GDSL hydrolase family protein n=1 Tax=unclassified Streptomyces TaxID=2593676 RepID=UPI0037961F2F